MKKFNDKPNIVGDIIRRNREKMNYSNTELSHKLDLLGVGLDRFELYKIENSKTIVKDFELVALCIVLNIDFNEIKEELQETIENYA